MPRFIQQEARPSGREKRLDQLGSLLALSQAAQAPQQQAEESRMRMALSLLGLAQQGQATEQQNAFHQQQLEQQKASEANRQGEYWGGRLPMEYAGQADAKTMAEAELRRRMQGDVMQSLQQNPQMLDAYMRQVDPAYGQAAAASHQQQVMQEIPKQEGIVRSVYSTLQHDPQKLQQLLTMLQPTMHPDVWNGLPWDQMNQMLAGPETKPQAGSDPTARVGGLLGEGGLVDKAASVLPSKQDISSGWQRALDMPDSPVSLLFGRKKNSAQVK